MKTKLFKLKKALKNSKEVLEFFDSKKETAGIIPYKGGFGIVENKKVKEIYVGVSALANAIKNAK